MSEHYYTRDPKSAHREEERRVTVNGREFSFLTDNGVFSKGGADAGSMLLADASRDVSGRILDLGCGWGFVGISLLGTVTGISAVFTDINARAADLCRRNLKINGLEAEKVVCGDGFENVEGMFDHILLNPPIHAGKQVMYRLFGDALSRLKPGGTLRVVIMTRQGADSAEKELKAKGGNCEIIARGGGYKVLMTRRTCED